MNAMQATHAVTAPLSGDDERSLLMRIELLLEREEEMLATRDAAGLTAIAEEREGLVQRLADAARKRRVAPKTAAIDEAELIELYRRLRQRHDVRAQVVRRHVEHNSRAVGVLAQATGQNSLYKADGSVTLRFVSI
jgi:flagellar biosynthesis/type III secretory pathway chaperone